MQYYIVILSCIIITSYHDKRIFIIAQASHTCAHAHTHTRTISTSNYNYNMHTYYFIKIKFWINNSLKFTQAVNIEYNVLRVLYKTIENTSNILISLKGNTRSWNMLKVSMASIQSIIVQLGSHNMTVTNQHA